MQVNIGGDRIGSGAKMQVDLHTYNRSTHNLSKKFQSSLAPGILYPAYVNVGLNGDKFDIDIESIFRTLPTQGPLFGAFKTQIDCYVAPIRLYHGILHNNPINLGFKMNQVKMPKYRLETYNRNPQTSNIVKQINSSCIWKYLGLSGLGLVDETEGRKLVAARKFNALPILAYYDIFKNYYANKQEDYAYVVKNGLLPVVFEQGFYRGYNNITQQYNSWADVTINDNTYNVPFVPSASINKYTIAIYGKNINSEIPLTFRIVEGETTKEYIITAAELKKEPFTSIVFSNVYIEQYRLVFDMEIKNLSFSSVRVIATAKNQYDTKDLNLERFKLENIDKMRENLLSIKLGEEYVVNDEVNFLPYNMFDNATKYELQSPLTGLVVKTYQSDIFNNWIKTETIDGENGISAITRVDTSNGLDLDALNLAQKVYNMLNRIAVSGGTYEDWQEAVYTASSIRKAETPMYMGGASSEIMFEEILATTATDTTFQGEQALGEMGGRGKQIKEKGGHIKFTVEEPSIIICMLSITPRITYSQGNRFYLTEIDTIDDLHKPALDGIGFQDLLVEKMAFTGTKINADGKIVERLSAGKSVAWIDYMTDYNECYGDFAEDGDQAFMVLNRDYNIKDENGNYIAPTDITTYIDPSKYNYAFAFEKLEAQNFWSEIQFNITARRLMSAKQIPNL